MSGKYYTFTSPFSIHFCKFERGLKKCLIVFIPLLRTRWQCYWTQTEGRTRTYWNTQDFIWELMCKRYCWHRTPFGVFKVHHLQGHKDFCGTSVRDSSLCEGRVGSPVCKEMFVDSFGLGPPCLLQALWGLQCPLAQATNLSQVSGHFLCFLLFFCAAAAAANGLREVLTVTQTVPSSNS